MKKPLHYKLLFLLILPSFCGHSQSWIQQSSNNQVDLATIYASSNNSVFSYGDSLDIFGGFATGSQYKTVNKGFTWGYQDMGSQIIKTESCFFHDDNNGVIVGENQLSGNGLIATTTNGGASWSVGVPHVERFKDVHFVDAMNGWAAGRNDYVVSTTDGGMNWTDVSSNAGDHLLSIYFTNSTNGYVAGAGGVCATTIDGGANWSNLNIGTGEDIEGLWFINDSTGWAVGTAGVIFVTSDYGLNWNLQTSGTAEDLLDVEFVNDSIGWCVGTAGTVLKTTDAGITWNAEVSGTAEDILSLTMRNESLGWFCGTNGTIFIYAMSAPNQIDESYFIETTLYPVPADNSLNVRFESYQTDVRLKMISITGQTIYESSFSGVQLKLNTADFPSGTYVLQSLGHGNVISKSFVVLH